MTHPGPFAHNHGIPAKAGTYLLTVASSFPVEWHDVPEMGSRFRGNDDHPV